MSNSGMVDFSSCQNSGIYQKKKDPTSESGSFVNTIIFKGLFIRLPLLLHMSDDDIIIDVSPPIDGEKEHIIQK